MGAEQSSYQSGSNNQNDSAVKTCYYEVLGAQRHATNDEIKKAYRKKALELHPDRNYGDIENATAKFAEVQSAYEVLSDPQERSWYDSHRDSILRGDGGGPSDGAQFEHNVRLTNARDIVGLISRFNPQIPFTDGPKGFYGILQGTFARLSMEENSACDWEGLDALEYPEFGSSGDNYEDVVKPFYRVWINFSTKKTFSWRDAYKSLDAPDRATRRLFERENKRLRDEGIREFNDAVRALVAFVRKRDPRFIPNSQTEADRQKILRDAAAAQAAKSRAANQARLDVHVVPDWAKSNPSPEGVDVTESSESDVEHIRCVACGKAFKSENQYETHERSKKHVKAVQQLQREMRKENRHLNLVQLSDSESSAPTERFESLVFEDKSPSDPDEIPLPFDEPNMSGAVNESGSQGDSTQEAKTSQVSMLKPEFNDSGSDSSELGDEYAPRQDVENRLAGSALKTNFIEEVSVPFESIDGDNNSDSLPKLGKAKAKRAKKIARQQIDMQGSSKFQCATCNNTFPSQNKLFTHIKELDHAQSMSKVVPGKNKNWRG